MRKNTAQEPMQTHMAEYFIRFIKFQNEYTNVKKLKEKISGNFLEKCEM